MKLPDGNIKTVANVITVSGAALVAKGIHDGVDTPKGLVEVVVGRGADLIDGPTARSRGEDSDLGALLDASCDKVGCAAIAFFMWRKDIVPTAAFVGMALQNSANGYATAKAQKAHPDKKFLPSKAGKLAMFSQNVSLISYDISHTLSKKADSIESDLGQQEKVAKLRKAAKISRIGGHVAAGVGVLGLGIPATRGYFKRI